MPRIIVSTEAIKEHSDIMIGYLNCIALYLCLREVVKRFNLREYPCSDSEIAVYYCIYLYLQSLTVYNYTGHQIVESI